MSSWKWTAGATVIAALLALTSSSAGADDGCTIPLPRPGAPAPTTEDEVAGPTPHAVVAAALAAAGYDHDPATSWRRRARLAGLIPYLGVRAGRNTRWQAAVPDVGHGTSYEVRASWRLDRLAFDGRELQSASIQAARRRERGRLASRVIRLLFVWRQATAAGAAVGGERAAAAAAELDALTDDWFTRSL